MESVTNLSRAELIRKRFRDWMRSRTPSGLPASISESTLIQGGCYVGRRFSLMGYSLVWMLDEQRISVIEPDGSSVGSASVDTFCVEGLLGEIQPVRSTVRGPIAAGDQ